MNQFSILVFILLMSAGSFAGRPSSGTSGSSGNGVAASPSNGPNTQNETAQPDTTAAPTNPQNTATPSGPASNSNNMITLSVGEAAATGAGLAFSAAAITGAVLSRTHRERQKSFNEISKQLLDQNLKMSKQVDSALSAADWYKDSRMSLSQNLAQAKQENAAAEQNMEFIQDRSQKIRQDLTREKFIARTLGDAHTTLDQTLKFVEGADASFGGLKDNLIKALETKVSKLGNKKSESKEEVVTSSGMETVSSSSTSDLPKNPQSETSNPQSDTSNNVTKKGEEASKDHLEGLLNKLRNSKSQTLQQLHDLSREHVQGYETSATGRSALKALQIIKKVHENHPKPENLKSEK